MDLVRKLLFALEAKDTFAGVWCDDFAVEGYDQDQVCKHLNGMAEAGLVVFEAARSTTNPDRFVKVMVFDLSWTGHELLDSIRDPKIWTATKTGARKIGGISLELLTALAVSKAKEALGLSA